VQSPSVCDPSSYGQHGPVCRISSLLLLLHSKHPAWLHCSSLLEHYSTHTRHTASSLATLQFLARALQHTHMAHGIQPGYIAVPCQSTTAHTHTHGTRHPAWLHCSSLLEHYSTHTWHTASSLATLQFLARALQHTHMAHGIQLGYIAVPCQSTTAHTHGTRHPAWLHCSSLPEHYSTQTHTWHTASSMATLQFLARALQHTHMAHGIQLGYVAVPCQSTTAHTHGTRHPAWLHCSSLPEHYSTHTWHTASSLATTPLLFDAPSPSLHSNFRVWLKNACILKQSA